MVITEATVAETSDRLGRIRAEIGKRIIGQTGLIDGMLMALIAGGHVLIEGVPGLAKTLAVKTLAVKRHLRDGVRVA